MSGHTPGPWRWEFNAAHKTVSLCGGIPRYDKTVMDFDRWGMSGACPRFTGQEDGFRILHKLSERKDWVTPIHGREHHASWCATVDHPDARLIAAAPELLEALKDALCALEVCGRDYDHVMGKSRAAIAKATGE